MRNEISNTRWQFFFEKYSNIHLFTYTGRGISAEAPFFDGAVTTAIAMFGLGKEAME
jgi:hypothetical protein